MTRARSAVAAEALVREFRQGRQEVRLRHDPAPVLGDDLFPGSVSPDDERVAPLTRPSDEDVVRAPVMNDKWMGHKVVDLGGLEPPTSRTKTRLCR